MIIGLISDTHGRYDDRIDGIFANVDAILHAGDVVETAITRRLGKIAPVTVVKGNCDYGLSYNEREVIELEGRSVLMQHIIGTPSSFADEAVQAGAQIVVSGHTHVPHDETHNGVLFLNPGSATQGRHGAGESVAILRLTADEAKFKLHPLM